MPREYSKTLNNFSSEQRIRDIVQEELEDFFSAIKTQIERKIKQIDRSIIEIRSDFSQLTDKKQTDLNDIKAKLNKVQKMISELRKEKEQDLEKINETIRSKSQQKDKSMLFRKISNAPNLESILFGEENKQARQSESHSPKITAKPPLPKAKNQKQYNSRQAQNPLLKNFSRAELPENINNNWKENITNNEEEQLQVKVGKVKQYIQSDSIQEVERPNRIVESLNKNKNSFMRKKSLKKFGTIPEEDFEESLINSQE